MVEVIFGSLIKSGFLVSTKFRNAGDLTSFFRGGRRDLPSVPAHRATQGLRASFSVTFHWGSLCCPLITLHLWTSQFKEGFLKVPDLCVREGTGTELWGREGGGEGMGVTGYSRKRCINPPYDFIKFNKYESGLRPGAINTSRHIPVLKSLTVLAEAGSKRRAPW